MKELKSVPKRLLSILLAFILVAGLFTVIPITRVFALDNDFNGNIDIIKARGKAIYISGWAYDDKDKSATCIIELHFCGKIYGITADKYRQDVDNAHNCGAYHGFEALIPVEDTGTYNYGVYVVNKARTDDTYAAINNGGSLTVEDEKNEDEDFYAYISNKGTHKMLFAESNGNIVAKNPSYSSNEGQLWHFEKIDINNKGIYYTVKNCTQGKYLFANDAGYYLGLSSTVDEHTKWHIHDYLSGWGESDFEPRLLIPMLNWETNIVMWDSGTKASLQNRNQDADSLFVIEKVQGEFPDYTEITLQQHRDSTFLTDDGSNAPRYISEKGKTDSDYDSQVWVLDRYTISGASGVYYYNIKNKNTGRYLYHDGNRNLSFSDSSSDNTKWILLGNSMDSISIAPYNNIRDNISEAWSTTSGETVVMDSINTAGGDSTTANLYVKNRSSQSLFTARLARHYETGLGSFYTTLTLPDYDPSNGAKDFDVSEKHVALSLSFDGNDNRVVSRRISTSASNAATPSVDQQWYFQCVGGDTYVIRNLANNMALYYTGEKLAFGEYTNDNKFKWRLVHEGGSNNKTYSIENLAYVKSLQVKSTVSDEGTTFALSEDSQHNHSIFHFDRKTTSPPYGENLGDTFFAYICPTNDNSKCLYYDYSASDNYIRTRDKEKKQENYWRFDRHADGSYTITSCNMEDHNIQLSFNSLESTNAYVYSNNEIAGTESAYGQRWFIRKYGGAYKLESKRNGKVFELNSDSLYYKKNTDRYTSTQMFDIIKTDLTVDTDMPNVKMHLFNYGNQINTCSEAVLPFCAEGSSNGETNNITASQPSVDGNRSFDDVGGLVPKGTGDHLITMQKSLDVNGYPYVLNNNEPSDSPSGFYGKYGSLKYLFDPEMGKNNNGFVQGGGSQTSYDTSASNVSYQSQHFEVESTKGLFRYNSNNGMYFYNALLNSAYFQRSTDEYGNLTNSGNFQLYDYTTSLPLNGYKNEGPMPDFDSVNGMRALNGNFMPFNKAHEQGEVTYGNYGSRPYASYTYEGSDGTWHDNTDYSYYGTKVPVNYRANKAENPDKLDFWFGMTMQCDFKMTSDGTYNGKDIVFEFQGDDDVWVYLDGVMILDIGGTHGAKAGSINFRTGVVTNPHSVNLSSNTLKDLYTEAVTERSGSFDYNDKTINQSYIDNNFTGNTFKANTKHRLDFFYMERYATNSYCNLQFNLPKGAVAVEKEVTGLDSDLSDPREYNFQIQKEDGTPLFVSDAAVNQTYSLEHADGSTEEKNLNSDCTFKLKDGEKAYFQDLENGQQYKVVELDVPSGIQQSATLKYYDTEHQTYTDPITYSGGVQQVNTSSDTIITFKNAVDPSSSITVTKQVKDKDGNDVTDSSATYNFGLHVFKTNNNGSVTDFGTKTFSIVGAGSKTISGLPQGAEYELWEYVPDDSDNNYEQPQFVDSVSSGTTITGRLVEEGSSPSVNDVISGTVSGNTVTVTNKYLPPKTVTITFKYYDRKKVSGEPANIDTRETSYSKSVEVADKYIQSDGNIKFAEMITDLGASKAENAISNVVDEYSLYTSQATAESAMTNKTYTWGETDGFKTNTITSAQAVYHTNSKRQPIFTVADQEKWVTYYQSGKEVDAESASFTDDEKVTNITVWLYNSPRKFTVNTHVPNGTSETGKTIKYEAYYNQRIGSYYGDDEEEEEYKKYCELYSIPKTEYDARGKVTGETTRYTTSGAAEKFGEKDFSYWTDAASDGNILSTDMRYNYRVTQNLELYANYGKEITKGVTSVGNGADVYYDTTGKKRLRINTIISPYGFKIGSVPDPGIKYVAAAYLIKTDSTQSTLTSEDFETVRTQIQNQLKNSTLTDEKTTTRFTIDGIGTVNLNITQLGNSYSLTNKNRMQFVASYPAPTKNRYVLALTALKYENGTEDTENGWYVSNNYVSHALTP